MGIIGHWAQFVWWEELETNLTVCLEAFHPIPKWRHLYLMLSAWAASTSLITLAPNGCALQLRQICKLGNANGCSFQINISTVSLVHTAKGNWRQLFYTNYNPIWMNKSISTCKYEYGFSSIVVFFFSVIGYCKLSLRIHFKLVQKKKKEEKCRNMKEVQ